MSGHQTLIKIGVACVLIVLGALFVGSQLSTGGRFMSLVPKATEEDEAGAVESADADESDARGEQDEDTAEAESVDENADEDAAEEDAAEEDAASDESEGDVTSGSDEIPEGDVVSDQADPSDDNASEGEETTENADASDTKEEDGDDKTDQAAADGRGPGGVEGGGRLSDDNGFSMIRGNR